MAPSSLIQLTGCIFARRGLRKGGGASGYSGEEYNTHHRRGQQTRHSLHFKRDLRSLTGAKTIRPYRWRRPLSTLKRTSLHDA
ncbi:hypothetical protein D3C85_610730 [compost metagenome]